MVRNGWARNKRFFGFGLNNYTVPATEVGKTGRGTG